MVCKRYAEVRAAYCVLNNTLVNFLFLQVSQC